MQLRHTPKGLAYAKFSNLSHQPGGTSSELSSGITKIIVEIIEKLVPNGDVNIDGFHHYVRKSAHFIAYLLLGILSLNALKSSNKLGYHSVWIALLLCVLYASCDELHQLCITGRSGEVKDVLIDSAGASIGIGIWSVIGRLWGGKSVRKVRGPW